MRKRGWVGLVALVFLLLGCNKEELEKMRAENTRLQGELTKLKGELKVFQDADKEKRSAKEDARKRALAYYRAMADVVALQEEGDEAVTKLCAFFTCDSMATKADVKQIVRHQRVTGLRGWRIPKFDAPKSRVELLADGKVKLVVESKSSIACLLRGKAAASADGVRGCKKAHQKPWRSKCEHMSFTFVKVDGVWKRSGAATPTTVACP